MHRPPLPSRSLESARSLRRGQTDAERALWRLLRGGQLDGWKFRRQHAIPPYVADFYCEAAKLVVELDGSQHSDAVDVARTQFLQAHGMKVLRFWDNDVLKQPEAVVEAIFNAIGNRTLTQPLSRWERGFKQAISIGNECSANLSPGGRGALGQAKPLHKAGRA